SLSETALERPVEVLRPIRGRLLDRSGQVLVSDEPAYDVTVHYGVLSMDPDYLSAIARKSRRQSDSAAKTATETSRRQIREQIAATWVRLSRASGLSMAELRSRRDEIYHRVESLRTYLWRARAARGFEEAPDDVRLGEDDMFHALIRDVTPSVRAAV